MIQWPLKGTVQLRPLTADGYELALDGINELWYWEDDKLCRFQAIPWFDQRWRVRFPSPELQLKIILLTSDCYRKEENAIRAKAIEKQNQVHSLISEIMELMKRAERASQRSASSRGAT